jgi:predicted TIM-barrel fold metal-dependent hydrolase
VGYISIRALWFRRTRPFNSDLDVRLDDLKKYGIEKQATCNFEGIDPNQLAISVTEQLKLCKVLNDDMAEMMRNSQGRIVALGSIPLRRMKAGGIEEMRRAISDHDLRGFEIVSNIRGVPIDAFPNFWDEVSRLGVPVYIPC